MLSPRRRLLINALMLFDLLTFVFCFLFATSLVDLPAERSTLLQFFSMRVSILNTVLFLVLLAIWNAILSWSDLYSSRRLSSLWRNMADIVKATFGGTMAVFIPAMLLQVKMIDAKFIFVFLMAICAITIMSRVLLRYGLQLFRVKGMNLRNLIIVGTNCRAIRLAQKLLSKPEIGYRLAGFVDDSDINTLEFTNSGYPLVADFKSFPEYIRNNAVDEVLICLPMKSHYEYAAGIISHCEEHGIIVRFLSDLFNLKLAWSRTDQFERESIITLCTGHMSEGGLVVKRVLDFVLSILLIIIFSPLLLITALVVKMTSEGPVLFMQERLGLNKRRFKVYKFRTMYADAEKRMAEIEHLNEVSGPVFKIRNDPRISPIGKFLRKSSIDELPQLFNVLKGDMSLVGPRPMAVRDYNGFDQDWHRRRFSVRPGITCLWQISGRSNIPFDRWMELDMEYIDNWSLWLDLKILVGTIPAVLRGSGAA